MAIKFSELTPRVSTLSSADLFAVTDASEGTSVAIDFGSLKGIIVDQNTFTDNAALMISALNDYDNGTGVNGLDAATLGGYSPAFYRTYANLTGKPTIPTSLANLDNSANNGYISIANDIIPDAANPDGYARLTFKVITNGQQVGEILTVDTSYIPEGVNKYYTDDRVEAFVDANFGDYYNSYAATFDEGNVKDSFYDTIAIPSNVSVTNEYTQLRIYAGTTSNPAYVPGTGQTVQRVDQRDRFDGYRAGQNIRIFGADVATNYNPTAFNVSQVTGTVNLVGLRDEDPSSGNPYNSFQYRIAEFDLATGQIATGQTLETVLVGVPTTVTDPVQVQNFLSGNSNAILDSFSIENFITINFTSSPTAGRGLLIYRKVGGAVGGTTTLTMAAATVAAGVVTVTTVEDHGLTDGKQVTISNVSGMVELNGLQPYAKVVSATQFTLWTDAGLTTSLDGSSFTAYTSGGSVVYANTNSVPGVSKLCAVLGPKEIATGKWIDYYTDDIVDYSTGDITYFPKNSDNTYLPDFTVHFKPLVEPSSYQSGWADTVITGVTYSNPLQPADSAYITITVADPLISTSSDGVWVCHDDTAKIQRAINNNSVAGRKAVQLNPKNYMVSELTIPSNFGISGFAYNTKMTKIPWTGYELIPTGRMIRSASATFAKNISLVGFDIDGNAVNQVLYDDSTVVNRNYCIDWGLKSDSILIDKVRLTNPMGGGIYASDGTNFKIFASEVRDSGLSSRHIYSPLIVDGGENTSIVSNRFQNFTDVLDVSVTNKGVIEGNIIANCGTGLLVYGSRFLVTSPNILVGPADEFLPNPDAYNSVYDSINIDLSESIINGSQVQSFDSDKMKYQENGSEYDLSLAGPNGIAGVVYKYFAIAKDPATGEEYEWIPQFSYSALQMNPREENDNLPSRGGFQFNIPADSVRKLRLYNEEYTPLVMKNISNTISIGEANVVGVQGDGTNIHYECQTIASVDIATPIGMTYPKGSKITVTGLAPSGYNVTNATVVSANNTHVSVLGSETGTVTDSAGTVVGTIAGNADHIGMGWSAFVDQWIPAGVASQSRGEWSVDGANTVYTFTATDYKYLALERKIRMTQTGINAHSEFSPGQGAGTYGVVTSIGNADPAGKTKSVSISWVNADINTAVGGIGGTFEVENTFVLAQGRIK